MKSWNLTTLDYFQWGYGKTHVYGNKFSIYGNKTSIVDELKANIEQFIRELPVGILHQHFHEIFDSEIDSAEHMISHPIFSSYVTVIRNPAQICLPL